eukprot:GHVL01012036.1.p1 GENE.GHVL01012036.1~~GHVL01012036.1.p1  ORF type:complete len:645 (-),score=153.90 GHVL01012036.1:2063-3934(-)
MNLPPGEEVFESVSASCGRSIFITSLGRVFGCGTNICGVFKKKLRQLTFSSDNNTLIKKGATNNTSSLFITDDDTIYLFGKTDKTINVPDARFLSVHPLADGYLLFSPFRIVRIEPSVVPICPLNHSKLLKIIVKGFNLQFFQSHKIQIFFKLVSVSHNPITCEKPVFEWSKISEITEKCEDASDESGCIIHVPIPEVAKKNEKFSCFVITKNEENNEKDDIALMDDDELIEYKKNKKKIQFDRNSSYSISVDLLIDGKLYKKDEENCIENWKNKLTMLALPCEDIHIIPTVVSIGETVTVRIPKITNGYIPFNYACIKLSNNNINKIITDVQFVRYLKQSVTETLTVGDLADGVGGAEFEFIMPQLDVPMKLHIDFSLESTIFCRDAKSCHMKDILFDDESLDGNPTSIILHNVYLTRMEPKCGPLGEVTNVKIFVEGLCEDMNCIIRCKNFIVPGEVHDGHVTFQFNSETAVTDDDQNEKRIIEISVNGGWSFLPQKLSFFTYRKMIFLGFVDSTDEPILESQFEKIEEKTTKFMAGDEVYLKLNGVSNELMIVSDPIVRWLIKDENEVFETFGKMKNENTLQTTAPSIEQSFVRFNLETSLNGGLNWCKLHINPLPILSK